MKTRVVRIAAAIMVLFAGLTLTAPLTAQAQNRSLNAIIADINKLPEPARSRLLNDIIAKQQSIDAYIVEFRANVEADTLKAARDLLADRRKGLEARIELAEVSFQKILALVIADHTIPIEERMRDNDPVAGFYIDMIKSVRDASAAKRRELDRIAQQNAILLQQAIGVTSQPDFVTEFNSENVAETPPERLDDF